MALVRISGHNPTLAHVALSMNEAMGTSFTASDIARAAKARDQRVKDGRLISVDSIPNIFYELRIRSQAKVCNPATVEVEVVER